MAGGKRIGASSDAGDEVRALRSYDPGAPSESDMQVVHGTTVSSAAQYVMTMRGAADAFLSDFKGQLRGLQSDCESAATAIAELQELDGEIAAALRQMEGDAAPSRSSGRPGGVPEPTGDDDGKTSW